MSKHKFIGNHSNHLKIGIIGTTNVGKSTLFNMLSRTEINKAIDNSFLFCTIDPNVTVFNVKDPRFDYVSEICQPQSSNCSKITLYDTAGLVTGSFIEKSGVGTSSMQCLKHADVLIHVLREFEDSDVCHYLASVDAARDLEIVNHEILLMDIFAIEQALMEIELILMDMVGGHHLAFQHATLLQAWACIAGEVRPVPPELAAVQAGNKKKGVTKFRKPKIPKKCRGKALRFHEWDHHQIDLLANYHFLSAKEVLYVINVSPRDYLRGKDPKSFLPPDLLTKHHINTNILTISLAFEQNLYEIERTGGENEITEYFTANPTHKSANTTILQGCYNALGLIRFFTVNESELRSHTLRLGATVLEACALIDVRASRNFIRAEVIAFEDFSAFHGDRMALAMEGKLKSETRKYVVNDGDIVEFFSHDVPSLDI